MKIELRRAVEGTHFVVCIYGEKAGKQLIIPLSPRLSGEIERMLNAEGIPTELLIAPRN